MNLQNHSEVAEFLGFVEKRRGVETASALRGLIQTLVAEHQTVLDDPFELLERAHNQAHAEEIQAAVEIARAKFRSNVRVD